MNCFFCNQKLDPDDPACHNTESQCWQHNVIHHIVGAYERKIKKAEFIGELKDNKIIVSYNILPYPDHFQSAPFSEEPSLVVLQEYEYLYPGTIPGMGMRTGKGQRKILELPYPPITLRPDNYQEKIKTYLLFS